MIIERGASTKRPRKSCNRSGSFGGHFGRTYSARCILVQISSQPQMEDATIMHDSGFTRMAICRALGMSYKVLRRLFHRQYSTINDAQLDEIVKVITEVNGNFGIRTVTSILRVYGLRVQRCRVASALRRLDPEAVSRRRAATLRRRVYNVPHVNFLWHIDGNHRLIR